jgi:hypothetical protein
MSKSRAPRSALSAKRKQEQGLAGWNDTLAVWRVCENSACQRAQCCRGDVRSCTKAKFSLLPEGVQTWFMGMMWAKEQELSFDEAIDMLKPSGANDAWAAWTTEGTRLELNEPPAG